MRLIDANLLVDRLKENMRNKLESGIALDKLYGAIDGVLVEMIEDCPTADTDYCPWHDLRKNQYDLPLNEGHVLICYDDNVSDIEYMVSSYRRVWNPITGDAMSFKRWELPQYYKQSAVVAWKEIERFDKNE